MKGYICRPKDCDRIMISISSKPPEIRKEDGWYVHIPGWFDTMYTRTFRKHFGFSIKPGTHEAVNISISISRKE